MFDFVIAKYIRLSMDETISESMSIPSQRMQLDNHIEDLDIPNATIMEFVDNGHSGTTFDRPAFQEMLSLVNSGMIHCIITKDFSRFSRNALECGYFIEFICPLFGVRFISVSDYFDTAELGADTGGIEVSFKYMMHEYYSHDISKKVKSVKRDKMARGTNIVANAIYGYRKNDNGKWEPDPESAEVVQKIFQMALNGMATSQIRDKLCTERYPTPSEYIQIKRRGKDIIPKCVWTARMVYHMLTNEQYTGSYVSGKQESKSVGSRSKNHTDKSQWIIYPNSHPAIVSKDDFDKVQYILKNRKGSRITKPVISSLTEENLNPKRQKMLTGEQIVAAPIYGYAKNDDGSLKIDEPAALIIRKIFEYAAQGLSFSEISGRLSELKYPNPSEYIKLKRGNKITPTNRWTDKSVRSILKNIQYTGAYVSGKILVDKTGKKYHTPQNEWIIIPDKHPAIVSKDAFNEVQSIITERRFKRKNIRKRDYLLRGIIACGHCGYALFYDDSTDITWYRCPHTYADPNAACYKMKINAHEIEDTVWQYIKKMAELVLGSIESVKLTGISDNLKILSDYESQINEITKDRRTLYVDYVAKQVDLETFVERKNEMANRINTLNNQATALRKSHLENLAVKKSTDCANEVLSPEAVPREMIENLVEKVSVYVNYEIEVDFKVAFFKTAANNE